MATNTFDPKEVYAKYQNGQLCTDTEITQGITFFRTTERALRQMGPTFRLAANETARCLDWLQSVSTARKL